MEVVMEGKLRNGAQILRSKRSMLWPNTYVILAEWNENTVMKYVTWRVDKERNAHLGHYHKDLKKAVEDWEERG